MTTIADWSLLTRVGNASRKVRSAARSSASLFASSADSGRRGSHDHRASRSCSGTPSPRESRSCRFRTSSSRSGARQGDRPAFLIPLRLDEPAAFQVVANREVLLVRRRQEALLRLAERAPLPRRPDDTREERFHSARRHVHEEVLDLSSADRLQVSADRIKRPSPFERGCGLKNIPCPLGTLSERLRASPPLNLPFDFDQRRQREFDTLQALRPSLWQDRRMPASGSCSHRSTCGPVFSTTKPMSFAKSISAARVSCILIFTPFCVSETSDTAAAASSLIWSLGTSSTG